MFIVPLSVPSALRVPSNRRAPMHRTYGRAALIAWLAVGLIVLVCLPAARGGRMLGATLPFWLVVAPLLDLAWIGRHRIRHGIAGRWHELARARRMARRVRTGGRGMRAATQA
jgi:hypothetical protein